MGMSTLVSEMININFFLKAHDFSVPVLAKWILSECINIHTLKMSRISKIVNCCHNEIARLKKLKKIEVWVDEASDLKEVTLIGFRIATTLFTFS
jgi:hypothetical protein